MLVFIGTLHGGLTPTSELIKIVESFKPSRLLIEIAQEDIESNNVEKYPEEMKAVLMWGIGKHIEVAGFDSTIKTLVETTSSQDLKHLDKEQAAITSKHDWKDFNKADLDKILETKTWQKIVDETKNNERNMEMGKNITDLTRDIDDATTVIITGSGHIPFFVSKFSNAHFPLRSQSS